jgi:signal transduction histidine kinase
MRRRLTRRVLRLLGGVRTRVVWTFVFALALTTLVSVLVVRQVQIQRLDARIDAELRQEVEEIRILASGNDPETGEPFGERVDRVFEVFLDRNLPARSEALLAIVDGDLIEEVAAEGVPLRLGDDATLVARWAAVTEPERGHVATGAGRLEFLAVPFLLEQEPVGVFVVGIFRDLEFLDTDAATIGAAVVGIVAVAVGTLLARRLANRILAPVRAVTRTAQTIRETDLTQRIPVEGNDEIADLATTFNDMLDRLERAFTAQRRFTDDASHELRTPITIIRGHLEVMSDSPEDRAATLALVDDELDRAQRIVDDLLLLARAERPDFIRPRPTDVGELTDQVLEKARALGDRTWHADGRAEGSATLDGQRLTEALLQLAENAVRSTDAGAGIWIGSARNPRSLRFWVRDAGPGIAPEQQQRIFERFHRLPEARARSEGSGLGLAIVRAIAEGHGGRVELDSALGRGATFTIVIPLAGVRAA